MQVLNSSSDEAQIDAIANAIGKKWKRVGDRRIMHSDGYGIYILAYKAGSHKRFRVSVEFGESIRNFAGQGAKDLKISVSRHRTPEAIAAELQRRFFIPYYVELEKAIERQDKENAVEAVKKQITSNLKIALGEGEQFEKDGVIFHVFPRHPQRPRMEVKAALEYWHLERERAVRVSINSLSIERAKELLAWLSMIQAD